MKRKTSLWYKICYICASVAYSNYRDIIGCNSHEDYNRNIKFRITLPNTQVVIEIDTSYDYGIIELCCDERKYTSKDFCMKIAVTIAGIRVVKRGILVKDTLEYRKTIDRKYNWVDFLEESDLLNFYKSLEFYKVYEEANYKLPKWIEEEIDIYYNDVLMRLNNKEKKAIIQQKIDNKFYNPKVDTNEEQKQVCALLSRVLRDLYEENGGACKDISSQMEKHCLTILKDVILPSCGYEISTNELITMISGKKLTLERDEDDA